jgi:hypothetical protein
VNKFIFSLLAIIFSVGCCFSQDNTLTPKEKSEGWKLLFDGKSTDGWHTYGMPYAGKAWTVKEGAFYLNAETRKSLGDKEGGDLVTNEEYENFDLKLDWKIGVKGNSGVIFYIHEDTSKYPATYETGMEMQVLDNGTPTRRGHDDARLYTHRAGDLYDLDFYMNGVHSLSATLWNDNWKKMIAISKFKQWADFGTFRKGKISLQDHGEDVWFKNIRIKRL